ncbi:MULTISPECIES: DUF1491 family protein [Xanthobacter]|jgi:hypothetical protein|uniref:DUF1491 family protein n=1 Tax=Xanthobacter aminoxidans TaxID=186280 RepID=A0ABW6ZG98_9HYPH|nr:MULTISPECIES: DUF1491 family protein [Xanthobacter]MBN8916329.1 DUF1491 family protein [Hyphomicrobiales bacterium]UDQ90397.1 DUF1491 family protein [Xanthobacter autotrophicus]UJX44287.1 DUF1491 family protein [Xanthobacter sp. YC-JY1]
MRLKSAIFVSALIRRCQVEGCYATLVRKGAEEAGAIFVKVARLDGTAALYGPAPQSAFDESFPADRKFSVLVAPGSPEADADARIARELKFDPDIFVLEIEDRQGRHFLDLVE